MSKYRGVWYFQTQIVKSLLLLRQPRSKANLKLSNLMNWELN